MSLASNFCRKFVFAFSIALLAGCNFGGEHTGRLGNGEGFGGGDPFGGKLHTLRNEILVPATRGILSQVDIAGICDTSLCPQDEPLCQQLPSLSAEQEAECQALILQLAPQLNESLHSDRISLSGTTAELSHDGGEVAALTSHDGGASLIEVSYPRTQELGLDDVQLAALLAHEFFHTVRLDGAYISDQLQRDSFQGIGAGSRLLDVLGTMIVAYWLRNGNAPAILGGADGSHVSFGHVRLGQFKDLSFTLKNFGDERATNIEVGSIAAPFTLINNDCEDGLRHDGTCHLVLRYDASSPQRHAAQLEVHYVDSRRQRLLTISMEGQGAQSVLFAGGNATGQLIALDPFSGQQVETLSGFNYATTAKSAHCDVNGDGYLDLVAGSGAGSRPLVRVFSGRDNTLLFQRDAYNPAFLGGIDVACADVNGDSYGDVVTGAGRGGGPHVRVFSGADRLTTVLGDFFVTDPIHNIFGLVVEAADFDGDGLAEVAVGTSLGWGAQVHLYRFSPTGMVFLDSVVAYATHHVGVTLATGDVDGDGHPDLITGASVHGTHVKMYRVANSRFQFMNDLFTSHPDNHGVQVSTIDTNNDGISEIVAQSHATSQVTIWDPANQFAAPIANINTGLPLPLSTSLR